MQRVYVNIKFQHVYQSFNIFLWSVFQCTKNPYKPGHYKSDLMCCDGGLDFNPGHLTCDWSYDTECIKDHYLCPIVPPVGK